MIRKFMNWLFMPKTELIAESPPFDFVQQGYFSTDIPYGKIDRAAVAAQLEARHKPAFKVVSGTGEHVAMDAAVAMDEAGNAFSFAQQAMPDSNYLWFASQSFIGYQTCAIIAQHWLVDKACMSPAEDAVANDFELSFPESSDKDDTLDKDLKATDKEYQIKKNLIEFVKFSRVFGIRIAMFIVESDDPDYYKKPFNIDGVKKGTYKGISQIDPYWMTPQLTTIGATDIWSKNFYEPEFWQVSGKLIHKSHLCIIRHSEVADILKPSYLFGGLSLPQKIYERVYAAERTANEAPQLAMTKRTTALNIDMEAAVGGERSLVDKILDWTRFRDNYGVKLLGMDEQITQQDTSLADLDNVIMTQYQLVASIANVPSVRLLGTSPKGFNATGDYEMKTYHEELRQLQVNDLNPLLERHYELVQKSVYGVVKFFEINWKPIDIPNAKEQGELDKAKADLYKTYVDAMILDPMEIKKKLSEDKDSGFNNLDLSFGLNDDDDSETE